MESQITKPCTKCGEEKLFSEFPQDTRRVKTGCRSVCLKCEGEHARNRAAQQRANTPKDAAKKCNRCGLVKDVDHFAFGHGKYGRQSTCHPCDSQRAKDRKARLTPEQRDAVKDYRKKYWAANAQSLAEAARLKATGFTREDVARAIELQHDACGICHDELGGYSTAAYHADHNHTTGEKRGLLCQRCNHAIGLFNDSTILLRRAAEYLENPPLRGVL